MNIIEYFYVIAFIVGIAGVLGWWLLPRRMLKHYKFADDKQRADIEDAFRKSVGQAFAGVGFIATFGLTASQFYSQQSQTDGQFKQRQELAERQFANQQFIEAAKLLKEGSNLTGTQAAGIYAMAKIASVRPEYTLPVANTIVAFVKNESKEPNSGKNGFRAPDASLAAQASISTLGEMDLPQGYVIDLSGSYLARTRFPVGKHPNFVNANFQGASLYGVDFRGLDLTGALFNGASLADWEAYGGNSFNNQVAKSVDYRRQSYLYEVKFDNATLIGAHFEQVWMGGARFEGACLAGAVFIDADLSRAVFTNSLFGTAIGTDPRAPKCSSGSNANFERPILIDAVFDNVDLRGLTLNNPNLSGADFSRAKNVDAAMFESGCTDRPAKLPDKELNLKRC